MWVLVPDASASFRVNAPNTSAIARVCSPTTILHPANCVPNMIRLGSFVEASSCFLAEAIEQPDLKSSAVCMLIPL